VTSTGNEREDIFKSRRDREKFLEYFESAAKRYDAVIHVFCLMVTHLGTGTKLFPQAGAQLQAIFAQSKSTNILK